MPDISVVLNPTFVEVPLPGESSVAARAEAAATQAAASQAAAAADVSASLAHAARTDNPHGTSAANLSYRAPGLLALDRALVEHLSETMPHVTAYGVDKAGIADVTATMNALMARGGGWFIPAGDYRVARPGPNSGGIFAALTKTTLIVAHPDARFFGDDLDNDLFWFSVPSDGVGLPADGIDFSWVGGFLDGSLMRQSVVVPSPSKYTALNEFGLPNQGASNTADLLRITLHYTKPGGEVVNAARRISVTGLRTRSGEHWEFSGGDSALFIGGGDMMTVERCRFQAARDLGIYASHVGVGAAKLSNLTVRDCHFLNCYFGIGPKRGLSRVTLTGNRFTNCVGAVYFNANPDIMDVSFFGNHFDGQVFGVRGGVRNMHAWGNTWGRMGAYRADGVTLVADYGSGRGGYWMQGATDCTIESETFGPPEPGFTSVAGVRLEIFDYGAGNLVKSTGNSLRRLRSNGFPVVTEIEGETAGNVLDDCLMTGTPAPTVPRHPFLRGDGSILLPALRTQPHPGYQPNFWYPLWDAQLDQGTSAVAAVNRWQFYAFPFLMPLRVKTVLAGCVTGGAGSSAKFGIWRAGGIANGYRPIGTPLVWGNTPADTSVSASSPSWPITPVVEMGAQLVWIGTIFTTSGALPRMTHVPSGHGLPNMRHGTTASINALRTPGACITTPGTFADDVATVEFTAATPWTNATAAGSGCPLLGVEVSS